MNFVYFFYYTDHHLILHYNVIYEMLYSWTSTKLPQPNKCKTASHTNIAAEVADRGGHWHMLPNKIT